MEQLFTQQWRSDGLRGRADFASHAIIPEYDEHGRVTRVMRVKPTQGDGFSERQETRFDDAGRVTEVKDNAGGNLTVNYDANGNLAGVTTIRLGAVQQQERVSNTFTRDDNGKITRIHSPAGLESYAYDASGNMREVVVKNGPAEAKIEFSDGRPKRLTQFDGSCLEFDYQQEGAAKGQLKAVHYAGDRPALWLCR